MKGYLTKAEFGGVVQLGWEGLTKAVGADGMVSGISTGTGVGTTIKFYNDRPTDYLGSSPGLGSVFRAMVAYDRYQKSGQRD